MGKPTETYRLIYTDREEAIADLKSRDILDEDGNRKSFPVHNCVMDIKIPEAKATFDTDGGVHSYVGLAEQNYVLKQGTVTDFIAELKDIIVNGNYTK